MSTPIPHSERELVHSRSIAFKGYRRTDGLFDIEGHLVDLRPSDATWPGGGRSANQPIHSMLLRLTVDKTGLIKDAVATTGAAPYDGACGSIAPRYASLRGVRVGAGFRQHVLQLVGGTGGCTHMTELLLAMGTAVIQTLAGQVASPPGQKPFNLDKCHALDTSASIVAQFYPLWYRPRPATTQE